MITIKNSIHMKNIDIYQEYTIEQSQTKAEILIFNGKKNNRICKYKSSCYLYVYDAN